MDDPAAPTIGHPADVSMLFVAMSDARARVVAQIVTAAAPVTSLVTAVGIAVAWRGGSRHRAAAMALCLVLLIVLPPVCGFALFFVFLHSPRHPAQTRTILADMTQRRWLVTGAVLSGGAIVGWWRSTCWHLPASTMIWSRRLFGCLRRSRCRTSCCRAGWKSGRSDPIYACSILETQRQRLHDPS